MAIVQISRITHRKGLQENLPQLAGAELGWSVDTRRLYIGNGTLEEGAPVIGNTEILTEFSDIFALQTAYTYKGEAAGYTVQTGPTPNDPVSQSLQSWLDQFATVKDFGAVGDGIADDTAAINRALQQLYCIEEDNVQARRSLFFPAGVYKISSTIIIPPFATLYGEGKDNTIIQMQPGDDSALRAYVARTGDSLQQTGVNIGTNGATEPQFVTVRDMAFETLDRDVTVFYAEDLDTASFVNVRFAGPLTTTDLDTDLDDIAGVRFDSTTSLITKSITFDQCEFTGTTFGLDTNNQVQGVTVSNSKFHTLFKGITLGATGSPVAGGPVGWRILHNLFDTIYAEGIEIGSVQLNGTGYNIFLNVGNYFGSLASPETSIIKFSDENNISVGDMFQRTAANSTLHPRVEILSTSIGFTNGEKLQMGTYTRDSGISATLAGNVAVATTIFSKALASFSVNYSILRDTARRTGTITVSNDLAGNIIYSDDFVETASTGVTLTVVNSAGVADIKYTNTNSNSASFVYSVSSTQ